MKQNQQMGDRWQTLAQVRPNQLTAEEQDEFIQLDWQQIHTPLPNQLVDAYSPGQYSPRR